MYAVVYSIGHLELVQRIMHQQQPAERKAAKDNRLFNMLQCQSRVRIQECPVVSDYVQHSRFTVNTDDRGCNLLYDCKPNVLTIQLCFQEVHGGDPRIAPFVIIPVKPNRTILALGGYLTDRELCIVYQLVSGISNDGITLVVTDVTTHLEAILTVANALDLAMIVQ